MHCVSILWLASDVIIALVVEECVLKELRTDHRVEEQEGECEQTHN
jgi:hypothetical protein